MEGYKESKLRKVKNFFKECKRILKVTKKPSREEYKTIVKVSAIGMGIVGLLGFLINMGKQLIFG
ncbi:protein translocase SEC61 complex subunit gamma [Nanoarchaeota archaeon]